MLSYSTQRVCLLHVCACLYFQDRSLSESPIAIRLCELHLIWLHLIGEREFFLHHLAFRTQTAGWKGHNYFKCGDIKLYWQLRLLTAQGQLDIDTIRPLKRSEQVHRFNTGPKHLREVVFRRIRNCTESKWTKGKHDLLYGEIHTVTSGAQHVLISFSIFQFSKALPKSNEKNCLKINFIYKEPCRKFQLDLTSHAQCGWITCVFLNWNSIPPPV